MLAELVDHVTGIDPDKDWITAAIIETDTTRFIESARFSADRDGYTRAVAWADEHTTPGERVWAIEGSASFGRGLTAALSRADEWVIEFDWARQKATKDAAKSLDASHNWTKVAAASKAAPKAETPAKSDLSDDPDAVKAADPKEND